VNITEQVPNNTHFYYQDAPSATGDISNVKYLGPVDNLGAGTFVGYHVDILAHGTATIEYSVTVD